MGPVRLTQSRDQPGRRAHRRECPRAADAAARSLRYGSTLTPATAGLRARCGETDRSLGSTSRVDRRLFTLRTSATDRSGSLVRDPCGGWSDHRTWRICGTTWRHLSGIHVDRHVTDRTGSRSLRLPLEYSPAFLNRCTAHLFTALTEQLGLTLQPETVASRSCHRQRRQAHTLETNGPSLVNWSNDPNAGAGFLLVLASVALAGCGSKGRSCQTRITAVADEFVRQGATTVFWPPEKLTNSWRRVHRRAVAGIRGGPAAGAAGKDCRSIRPPPSPTPSHSRRDCHASRGQMLTIVKVVPEDAGGRRLLPQRRSPEELESMIAAIDASPFMPSKLHNRRSSAAASTRILLRQLRPMCPLLFTGGRSAAPSCRCADDGTNRCAAIVQASFFLGRVAMGSSFERTARSEDLVRAAYARFSIRRRSPSSSGRSTMPERMPAAETLFNARTRLKPGTRKHASAHRLSYVPVTQRGQSPTRLSSSMRAPRTALRPIMACVESSISEADRARAADIVRRARGSTRGSSRWRPY